MKKIAAILLCLGLLFMSACQTDDRKTTQERDDKISVNSDVQINNNMMFGIIEEPIENFNVLPMPETVPYVYEENGLFGYKNADGSVLLEAQYGVANEFYDGFGSVRKDTKLENGEMGYEWFDVNSKGELFSFDSISYNKDIGLWICKKDGKYGVVNSQGEEIIPFDMDILSGPYAEGCFTSIKDNDAVCIDLKKGCYYISKPYKEKNKDNYISAVNLSDYDFCIINGLLTVNGEEDLYGQKIPFDLIKKINWNCYFDSEEIFSQKAVITDGGYEGVINFSFTNLTDEYKYNFFAVPDYVNTLPTKVEEDKNTEKYKETIELYLKDKNIENTPYTIKKAFIGNILNNEKQSAVINIEESDEFNQERWDNPWEDKDYKDNHTAIFSSILIIPDCEKPTEYYVQEEIINQENKPLMGEKIALKEIADIFSKEGYELIVLHYFYEGGYVSVCEIK